MSELDTTVLIFTKDGYDRWRTEGLYIYTGKYYMSPKVPEEKRPQANGLYTLDEVFGFLEEVGDAYNKNTCYIDGDEQDLCGDPEYDRKNLACFIRSGLYEFLSAEMWDEDNNADHDYTQRIHKKHTFLTPGGETVIVELAAEETW